MSWAEVGKAINTNLNKALNVLIDEKHTATDALINSKHTTTDALINSLKTGGSVPIVKSVQRGRSTAVTTGSTSVSNLTISISQINAKKAIAILNFGDYSWYSADSSGQFGGVGPGYGFTLSDTALTIYNHQASNNYGTTACSWQVNEFY